MASGIYVILNTIAEKFYIGSAVHIRSRINTHIFNLRKNKHANTYLQSSWNKYGENAFEFGILELVEDKTKLLEREQHWVDKTNCCNPDIGYNSRLKVNSNLGMKFTEETKRKMSEAGKNKNFIVTDDFRKKMSLLKTGVKMSDEARKNMSLGAKGKKLSEEHKLKMSLAQKNRKRPDNIGQLISEGKRAKRLERELNENSTTQT